MKGVVGALLAQMLGKQSSFLPCDNSPVQVILCVAFVLCISLHLSGPSLQKISGTAGMSA